MTHKDIIIDSDAFFEIDINTRQIQNKTPSKITLMQNDHNSERFTFSIARYVEGHDMAMSTKAEVHYINTDGANKSMGVYTMDDLRVDEADDSKVVCSWLISRAATKYSGGLTFLVRFICLDEDGTTITYAWSTAEYSALSIGKGMDNSSTLQTNYVDIIELWKKEIQINIENGEGVNSIQQPPEVDSWKPTNTRITDFLDSVGGTTGDGATVQMDKSGNLLAGAYGKNSTMLGAKSQTVGGKTFVAGSKCVAFENNAFALGNGNFAGGKHSGALNNETCALDNSALAINNGTTARGKASFSSGDFTEANGEASDAGGKQTVADGDFAFSRGMFGKAKGRASAVIGDNGIATGNNAVATGSNTVAGNTNTFASGHMTFAFGEQAHSENCHTFAGVKGFQITEIRNRINDNVAIFTLETTEGLEVGDLVSLIIHGVYIDVGEILGIEANGVYLRKDYDEILCNEEVVAQNPDNTTMTGCAANTLFVRKKPWLGDKVIGHHTHCEGYKTVAASEAQHVQGKFNKIDNEGKYAHIVGNGKTEGERSNAHTVDWKGNGWFAGDVEAQRVILTSPNGTRFALSVDDSGNLKTARL